MEWGRSTGPQSYIVVAMTHDRTSRQPKVSGTHCKGQLLSCQYDMLPNNIKQADICGIRSHNIACKSYRSLRKEGV